MQGRSIKRILVKLREMGMGIWQSIVFLLDDIDFFQDYSDAAKRMI
jgi:hypothetical protein